MGKSKTKAYDYAKTLYLDTRQKLTIQEIAARAEVRPNTVSRWMDKDGWGKQRKSLLVTRRVMIADLYDQLEFLNTTIKGRESKVASPNEAQTIAVITTSIKRLETETSVAEIYEVATGFLEFIKPIDFDLYKQLVPLFDVFIQSKIK